MGCLNVNSSLSSLVPNVTARALISPLSVSCEKKTHLIANASLLCYISAPTWEEFLLSNGVNLNVEDDGEYLVKVIKRHY